MIHRQSCYEKEMLLVPPGQKALPPPPPTPGPWHPDRPPPPPGSCPCRPPEAHATIHLEGGKTWCAKCRVQSAGELGREGLPISSRTGSKTLPPGKKRLVVHRTDCIETVEALRRKGLFVEKTGRQVLWLNGRRP